MKNQRDDSRFVQANREARYCTVLTLLYFGWWYVTAYGLGDADPATYGFTLGMPDWFFYSCVAGPLAFCLLCWVMVARYFKTVSLEDQEAPQR